MTRNISAPKPNEPTTASRFACLEIWTGSAGPSTYSNTGGFAASTAYLPARSAGWVDTRSTLIAKVQDSSVQGRRMQYCAVSSAFTKFEFNSVLFIFHCIPAFKSSKVSADNRLLRLSEQDFVEYRDVNRHDARIRRANRSAIVHMKISILDRI